MNTPARPEESVDFRLFGPVEAVANGRRIDLGSRRELRLLVGLLQTPRALISRDELREWIWSDTPASGEDELSRLMTALRKRLEAIGLSDVLIAKEGRCRLSIPTECIDAHRARTQLIKAGTLDDREATRLLREAWKSTRGDPIAGLTGERVDSYRAGLLRLQFEIELALMTVEVKLGRHREWLPTLERQFDNQTADVGVTELYLRALQQSGLLDVATRVFLRHHNALREYGHEVRATTKQLHERILRGEVDSPADPRTSVDDESGFESDSSADCDSRHADEPGRPTDPILADAQRTTNTTNFNGPVRMGDFVQGSVYHYGVSDDG